MKLITPIFLPVLILLGLAASFRFADRPSNAGIPTTILWLIGSLAFIWLVASLFNLALFAPIYWLLGHRSKTNDNFLNANPPSKH